jgi:MFS family permease
MKDMTIEKNAAQASWSEFLTAERIPRLALVCLGIWLNAADSLVTATIMPSVARDIGGYAFFAWPVAAYLVGAILGGAGAGRLSERSGLRVALQISAALYAVGCAVGALATGMGPFLIGRLLQGGGAGLVVGLCYVSANLLFPGALWRRVLAVLSLVWGVATILGPLLGGVFAESWRLLFWLFAGQAILFAVAAWALVPRGATDVAGSSIPVATLVRLALAILFLLLAGIDEVRWRAMASLVLGMIILITALRRDASAQVRLLPREASDMQSTSGQGYAAIFLFAAGAVGFTIYGAAILQSLYGLSPLFAGYVIGAEAMGWTVTALLVAELPHHADRICIRIGATVIVAGVVSLIFSLPSGSLAAALSSAIVLGSGFGAEWAFLTRRIVEHLPPEDRSIGSSALPSVQITGNAFGSSIAGLVANTAGAGHGIGPADAPAIATWLFVAATPLALLGWFSAWYATRDRDRSSKSEALELSGAE